MIAQSEIKATIDDCHARRARNPGNKWVQAKQTLDQDAFKQGNAVRYLQTLVSVSLACTAVAVCAKEAASYLCTIHRVESADEANAAVKTKRDADYLGKHFTVDRSTGIMRGSLNNAYQRLPNVIDLGTRDSAFKAVTTISFSEGFESGTNIHALTVMEFVPQKKKPFVYLWNADVFYGTCENR